MLKRLTLKQRFVLERRLGLTDGNVYTQEEIAAALGIDQSNVSRLDTNARRKILDMALPHKKTAYPTNK